MFKKINLRFCFLWLAIASYLQAQPVDSTPYKYSREQQLESDPLTGEALIKIKIEFQDPSHRYETIEPELLSVDPDALYICNHLIHYEDGHHTERNPIITSANWIVLEPGVYRVQKIIPAHLKQSFYQYLIDQQLTPQNPEDPIDLDKWIQEQGLKKIVGYVTDFYNTITSQAKNIYQGFPPDFQLRLQQDFNQKAKELMATGMYAKPELIDRRFWLWIYCYQQQIRNIFLERPQAIKAAVMISKPEIDLITKLVLTRLMVSNGSFNLKDHSGLYRIAHRSSDQVEWSNYLAFINPAFILEPGEWHLVPLLPDLLYQQLLQHNQGSLELPINRLLHPQEDPYQSIWNKADQFLQGIFGAANHCFMMKNRIGDKIRKYYLSLIETYKNPTFDTLLNANFMQNLRQAMFYLLGGFSTNHPINLHIEYDQQVQLNGINRWVIITFTPSEHSTISSSHLIPLASTRIAWHDADHPLHLIPGDYTITPLHVVDETRLGILGDSFKLQEQCFLTDFR